MKIKITAIIIFIATAIQAQKKNDIGFDMADFSAKSDLAVWLYMYDKVAWWTSDSLMTYSKDEHSRLGKDWFCFEQDSTWHAAYGKYSNGEYDLVFHFIINDSGFVERIYESVDTSLTYRYSRALQTAYRSCRDTIAQFNIRYNHYIKENEDKTINVWIFPAFQPDGNAIYGGEFIYVLDFSGEKIIKGDSYFNGFRAYNIDDESDEIWLNYVDQEKPTMGSVFFAWYYKDYFPKIYIDNATSFTTLIYGGDQWTWLTAMKKVEVDKKKKKSRKKS